MRTIFLKLWAAIALQKESLRISFSFTKVTAALILLPCCRHYRVAAAADYIIAFE
jgi:hypothetical protein